MLIKTQEHKTLIQNFGCTLDGVNNEFAGERFCGLYYDWKNKKQVLKTSYFIGVCWLEENNLALQIEPKIQNLDYLTMFLRCFKHTKVSQQLSKIYHIDFNKPKIDLQSNNFEITPLLIIHFLQVVRAIARKGLKKGYYSVEQNLNAKIKGRINISKTLKRNIFKGQNHKTVCNYQQFGIDCLENRLLKKALKFVQSYLAKTNIKTAGSLAQTLAYCLAPFELVSDEIDAKNFKNFNNNAFFKDYSQALKLAKMILKRFGYNLQNTSTQNKTPPFWIDMSLLFERYVYALLLDNNEVDYQYKHTDFLVGDIIIDTKYKPQYKGNYFERDDIGQLARYGRDIEIREKLGFENNEMAKCLIIYPLKNGKQNLSDLWDMASEIPQFKNFKKIGVKLPKLKPNA